MEIIPLSKLQTGDKLYVAIFKKGDWENPPQTRIIAYSECTVCATFYDNELDKRCLVVKKPNGFYCSKVFPEFSRDYTVVTITDDTTKTRQHSYNNKSNEPINHTVVFTTDEKLIIESAKNTIQGMKADKIDDELRLEGAIKHLNQILEKNGETAL